MIYIRMQDTPRQSIRILRPEIKRTEGERLTVTNRIEDTTTRVEQEEPQSGSPVPQPESASSARSIDTERAPAVLQDMDFRSEDEEELPVIPLRSAGHRAGDFLPEWMRRFSRT